MNLIGKGGFSVDRSFVRRLPVGVEPDGAGAHFRVWAPRRSRISIAFADGREEPLTREESGYFSGYILNAQPGNRYRVRIDRGADTYPDPASRFQPEGPHGSSQIVDPSAFRWNDTGWAGITLERLVLYEMHIGTFTPEGTWQAAARKLPLLKSIGVTCVEIMPVAEFSGKFGWGYDGVDLFAPSHNYGAPDEFRAFVASAHALELGVILDVVYNHFGSDGCYLKFFSEEYFAAKHANEWGEALNFDGDYARGMRDLVLANAAYWIEEFHLDGLRLDAVQTIHDSSSPHILSCISRAVREAAGGRKAIVIAESESRIAGIAKPESKGGYGIDGVWNDDFHHSAIAAMTGRNPAYYSDHKGFAQEFISAAKYGYLFQGQTYAWQGKRLGAPAFDVDARQFVLFLENHDQVANSLTGARLPALASPGRIRAFTALLLLLPGTPMLFQGQEFHCSCPFLYFADLPAGLRDAVERGRREFLAQFPNTPGKLDDSPSDPATYEKCKLNWSEFETHQEAIALHRDLLALRRTDRVFSAQRSRSVDGAVLGDEALVLRFFGEAGDDRLLFVNYGPDINRGSFPEPLIAPPEGRVWRLLWSSEDRKYGGGGVAPFEDDKGWHLTAHSAVVLCAGTDAHSRVSLL